MGLRAREVPECHKQSLMGHLVNAWETRIPMKTQQRPKHMKGTRVFLEIGLEAIVLLPAHALKF